MLFQFYQSIIEGRTKEYFTKNSVMLEDLKPVHIIKVGRPQQEQFIADYYNEEELNNLFKVVKDTPLELIVYLTTFYGLRRSEVLGIRWSATAIENALSFNGNKKDILDLDSNIPK